MHQSMDLGLRRNQIFNQGSFFCRRGVGVQSDLDNCVYFWKNPGYAPDSKEKQMMLTLSILPVYAYMIDSAYKS